MENERTENIDAPMNVSNTRKKRCYLSLHTTKKSSNEQDNAHYGPRPASSWLTFN